MGPDVALSVSAFSGVLLLGLAVLGLVVFPKVPAVCLWAGSWAWAGGGCLVLFLFPGLPHTGWVVVFGSQLLLSLGYLTWFGFSPALGRGALVRTLLWGGTTLALVPVGLGVVGRDPLAWALVAAWSAVPLVVSVWLLVQEGQRDPRPSVKAQSSSLLFAVLAGPGLFVASGAVVTMLRWEGRLGFAPFLVLGAGLTLRSLVHFDTRFHHRHTTSFLVERTNDAVVFLQADGRIQAVNPAFLTLVGREEPTLVGVLVAQLGADAESGRLLAPLETLRYPDWEGTLALSHRSGRPVPVHLVYRRVHNPAREAVGAVLLVHDLRAPHHPDLTTREDPLTALANRRWVLELFEAEFLRSQRYGGPLSALGIRVDRWEELKSRVGQVGADDVLRRIAAVLRGGLRKTDFCGRIGADEFLVVLPETPRDRAGLVATRLEKMYALASEGEAGVGLQMGLASLDESMATTDDFLARVRAAGAPPG